MAKKIIFIIFLFCSNCFLKSAGCFGQAYQFTQFYAAPTFLNPAFAGTGSCMRLTTDYRIQWPSISGGFRTYLLAFDHSIQKKNSGIGFLLTNDKAGSGNLRSTSFNAQYSYQIILTRKWEVSAGLEAGYAVRNYDFNKFIFGDQIAYGTAATVEAPNSDRIHYFDLSSGILFFSEKTWFGFSARHLNRPNQALISTESRLPILYSTHGGWVIPITNKGEAGKVFTKHSITVAFNYRAEKEFNQLDLGFYYNYYQLTLGAWYRGIPILKTYNANYANNDALAFLLGTAVGRFKFGYSYDVTISRLAGYSGGAHEISLSYQFCDPSKKKGKSVIPCPKF